MPAQACVPTAGMHPCITMAYGPCACDGRIPCMRADRAMQAGHPGGAARLRGGRRRPAHPRAPLRHRGRRDRRSAYLLRGLPRPRVLRGALLARPCLSMMQPCMHASRRSRSDALAPSGTSVRWRAAWQRQEGCEVVNPLQPMPWTAAALHCSKEHLTAQPCCGLTSLALLPLLGLVPACAYRMCLPCVWCPSVRYSHAGMHACAGQRHHPVRRRMPARVPRALPRAAAGRGRAARGRGLALPGLRCQGARPPLLPASQSPQLVSLLGSAVACSVLRLACT